MTRKAIIKKIPVQNKDITVLHSCTQVERLNTQVERLKRIELILAGNGHPEDGYIYKVMEIGGEIRGINEKLAGIDTVVNELHEQAVGMKAVGSKRQLTWNNIATIITLLIALVMVWQGSKGFKELLKIGTDTKGEVQTTNDVIIGSQKRGNMYIPPQFRDTINGINTH